MTAALTVPAHVQPYVEVLGLELTVALLLECGGAPLYLPDTRGLDDSRIVQVLGKDRALALGRHFGRGLVKVPLAKSFIAAYYLSQNVPVVEIARLLHVDRSTVQRWLPDRPGRQLSLFD